MTMRTTCNATSLFLLFLLIVATLLTSVPSAAGDSAAAVVDELNDSSSLADVVTFLRDGDYRLVRPSPSDRTAERQRHSRACQADLQRAYRVLTSTTNDDGTDKQQLIDAAQVVALCTTDNPKNRAKLTSPVRQDGQRTVVQGLVAMIRSGHAPSIAAAAECIWISSFNNIDNHNAFVQAGAVDALANVLSSVEPCQNDNTSCYHADMWCAAALQNLAATYCLDNYGYCDYEWVSQTSGAEESDGEHIPYKVIMSERSTPTGDPTPVRKQLLENKVLLETLGKGICHVVKDVAEHPHDRTWPSRVHVNDKNENDEDFGHNNSSNIIDTPHILPWAYMGLVKNLALDPQAREKMFVDEDVMDCICDYAVESPDWLEYGKAQDALWNLGYDYELFCEPMYDDEECQDYDDYEDDDGNHCGIYEEERWCAEFGAVENSDGVSPNEACCVCGGGNDIIDEL